MNRVCHRRPLWSPGRVRRRVSCPARRHTPVCRARRARRRPPPSVLRTGRRGGRNRLGSQAPRRSAAITSPARPSRLVPPASGTSSQESVENGILPVGEPTLFGLHPLDQLVAENIVFFEVQELGIGRPGVPVLLVGAGGQFGCREKRAPPIFWGLILLRTTIPYREKSSSLGVTLSSGPKKVTQNLSELSSGILGG